MSVAAANAEAAPRARARAPISRRSVIVVACAVAVAVLGVLFILAPRASETTDAAYITADPSIAAPRVRGLIAEILVAHNQAVRRGDPLVRLDPEEFEAKVAAASADLGAAARRASPAAHAALGAQGADEGLAAAETRSARSLIRAATAQSARADADQRRYDALVGAGSVARRDADAVRAAAVGADVDAEHSRAELSVRESRMLVVKARRAALAAALASALAGEAKAHAALTLARQDLDHTVIRAGVDGIVGDRQAEAGDYVEPGTRLLAIEPLGALYVTANFKETQVARMRAGQAVRLKVDALPGAVLTGRVDSFAPGTGTQFSLLPFEPGTGNFTKVVQRIPVRIRFNPGQDMLSRLRPGLSTEATVDVRTMP